jgi:hypothetical protein
MPRRSNIYEKDTNIKVKSFDPEGFSTSCLERYSFLYYPKKHIPGYRKNAMPLSVF